MVPMLAEYDGLVIIRLVVRIINELQLDKLLSGTNIMFCPGLNNRCGFTDDPLRYVGTVA